MIAIKNIKMHVVSTNQIADILDFKDKDCYYTYCIFLYQKRLQNFLYNMTVIIIANLISILLRQTVILLNLDHNTLCTILNAL